MTTETFELGRSVVVWTRPDICHPERGWQCAGEATVTAVGADCVRVRFVRWRLLRPREAWFRRDDGRVHVQGTTDV